MAWTATLTSVTKNTGDGSVDIVITISDGTDNWSKTFNFVEDDLSMTLPSIRQKLRDFFDTKAQWKSNYNEIKAREGQQLL
jgi:hypothetical protein